MDLDWVAQLSLVQIIATGRRRRFGAAWEHPEGVSIDIGVDSHAEANCMMSNRSPLTRARGDSAKWFWPQRANFPWLRHERVARSSGPTRYRLRAVSVFCRRSADGLAGAVRT